MVGCTRDPVDVVQVHIIGAMTTDASGGLDPERVWRQLLADLDAHMPELVEEFIAELTARGLYSPEAISEGDLRLTAPATLGMLISRLSGRPLDPEQSTIAASLGTRRAQQGIPLDALTEAVRIDLRILWRKLRALAGEEHVAVLAARFELLMSVVDDYVIDVQKSFLREQAALRRDARVATERDLSRLFNTPHLAPAALERIAQTLAIPVDVGLIVLAFDGEHALRAETLAEEELIRGRIFSYAYRDILCVFWPAGDTALAPADSFAPIPGVRLAAAGLADLPRTVSSARQILVEAGNLTGVSELCDVWASIAAAHLDALVPGTTADILAPLQELGEYEHERIVETVRAYLRTGSVKEAAEVVFCHRNTVVNRLASFRHLTGLDVSIPEQSALVHVSLHTHQR